MTTRARSTLPKYNSKLPFSYTEEEFASLSRILGSDLPVPKKFVRWWLEWSAATYLLNRDTGKPGPKLKQQQNRFERDKKDIRTAAGVLSSDLCRYVAQANMDIHDKLNGIAAELRAVAECYDKVWPIVKSRRRGNNVDHHRNEYFEQLMLFWEAHLKRPITDGYKDGVGPTAPVVLFIASCARPVIGNDAASLDAVRHVVRKLASRKKK